MKKILTFLAILLTSFQIANADRQIVSLDGEWTFSDPESGTTTVNVPHSWEKFEANKQAFQLIKTCTYEKTVDVSAYAGKRLLLDFEGVNKIATVSVDGVQVGKHDGGFSAFYVDITDACQGKNEVKVSVATTNISINTMPVNSDFTHWAGIYRDVNLVVVDPQVSFSNMDSGSKGVYMNYTMSNGDATITPTVVLDSKETGTATITTAIIDATGKQVKNISQDVTLDGSIAQTVTLNTFTFGKVHKWKGVKDPYLYTAEVTVSYNGTEVDKVSQKIGFRTYEVKDGKFYLNGELYQLHGVGMHQERDAATNVSTAAEREADINTVLEMGANALRTCHYPHNQSTYDLCDEKGIVCWVEVPFYLMMLETDDFKSNCTQCVKEMVKQGINHPSIIVWGIENEVNYYASYAAIYARMGLPEATAEQLGAYLKELATMVKELDPSRLVGEAEIDNTAYAQETAGWTTSESNINTVGFNIYTGWYSNVNGATQANKSARIETSLKNKVAKYQGYFDEASDNTTNYVMTEYGAGANINQHAYLDENFSWGGTDATKGYTTTGEFHPEEYQSYVHEGMIMALYGDKTNNVTPASNIWCAFAWSMFDFSCYRNEGGTTRLNTKGLITSDHKTKKDAFYLYKANWNTTDPFVYICSKRYTERPYTKKESTQVKVYSNCESVKLTVNGTDLGEGTKIQDGVFVWDNVAFEVNNNSVKAEGLNAGSSVCNDECSSWTFQQRDISGCTVTLSYTEADYTEGMEYPTVTVKDGTTTLKENVDYTCQWSKPSITDPKDYTPGHSSVIDEPARAMTQSVTLKEEQYSVTISGIGDYSGSTQEHITIKESGATAVTLDETSTTAPSFTEGTSYDITVNRTLKANQWNTLCLPFSMTADEITTAKLGTVMQMTGIENNVVSFENATTIEAGEMYIVKPTEAVTSFSVSGKTAATPEAKAFGTDWTVNAPMYQTAISQEAVNTKYVLSNDKFYTVDEQNLAVNGLRWYIQSTTAQARALTLSLDGQTTGINEVEGLNGLNSSNGANGKFIQNGRMVIVKDSKKFNTAGQNIK